MKLFLQRSILLIFLAVFLFILFSLLQKNKFTSIITPISKNQVTKNEKGWKDDFNTLDTSFWMVANRMALEGGIKNDHQGYFRKDNVYVKNGYLIMKLTQENGKVENNDNGVISNDSEIESLKKYGYGIYQWRMRMSSSSDNPNIIGKNISGQISAGFNFTNNSETEIDFEVEGQNPNQLEMTTWKNPDTSHFPTSNDEVYTFKQIPNMQSEFHTYKFIWSKDSIIYYVDDKQVAKHITHIPTSEAPFMANHWGTNSDAFGGYANVGITRYMLIDWVSYTPLE